MGKRYNAGKFAGKAEGLGCSTRRYSHAVMSTHPQLSADDVFAYLDDRRLCTLVRQARRRGASIGEATAQAVTVLWKLDRLTALRQQAGAENA
jgi:hypothetical protein